MCKEILEGKGVIVKRPDREYLLKVKEGEVEYDALVEEAVRLEAECDELYKTSLLPHNADYKIIDANCVKIIEEYTKEFG